MAAASIALSIGIMTIFFEPRGTRVTFGEYADDGSDLTLTRLRRF